MSVYLDMNNAKLFDESVSKSAPGYYNRLYKNNAHQEQVRLIITRFDK